MSQLNVNAIRSSNGTGNAISLTASDKTCTVNATNYPHRNLIINGEMQVNQRVKTEGFDDFNVVSGHMTTLDRWFGAGSSSFDWDSARVKQVSDSPDEFSNSLRVDIGNTETPGAGQNGVVGTRLEAQHLQHLAYGTSSAKTCTISFWVRSNRTGTYCFQPMLHDTGKYLLYEYTISSANTWEKKTITFSGSTSDAIANDNGRGMDLNWHLACHSDDHVAATTSWTAKPGGGTGSKYLATSNQVNLWDNTANVWYLTGVQLEVGDYASDFEHRTYQVELELCKRYCQVMQGGGAYQRFTLGYAPSTTDTRWLFPLRPEMRDTPSFAETGAYSIQPGSSFDIDDVDLESSASSAHCAVISTSGNSGLSAGQAVSLHSNNNSATQIIFDAEL
tara:strand:+ start:930 stop:2099 length:1170 start_codon:yes stop_codon:yes gene_type:complete